MGHSFCEVTIPSQEVRFNHLKKGPPAQACNATHCSFSAKLKELLVTNVMII